MNHMLQQMGLGWGHHTNSLRCQMKVNLAGIPNVCTAHFNALNLYQALELIDRLNLTGEQYTIYGTQHMDLITSIAF